MWRAAAFLLVLSLSGPATAGPFEDALEAYERGDYGFAVALWRPLAEQGNAYAQFNLGLMYHNGEGVPQDDAEAERWYRLAAEQGEANAQYSLGFMYHHGDGVPQDYAEAERWYRLAAGQGYADAQFGLGGMYANGEGVPQDSAEAARWVRLAAEQGYASAQYNLGLMYHNGDGVPQDYIQAHMWWNLSASRHTDPERRASAAAARDFVAAKMTPEQIGEAQRLAREWRPRLQ